MVWQQWGGNYLESKPLLCVISLFIILKYSSNVCFSKNETILCVIDLRQIVC